MHDPRYVPVSIDEVVRREEFLLCSGCFHGRHPHCMRGKCQCDDYNAAMAVCTALAIPFQGKLVGPDTPRASEER